MSMAHRNLRSRVLLRNLTGLGIATAMLSIACASIARAEEPASPPAAQESPFVVISATDTAALKAAIGQDVVVEGTIERAEWSRSGKVINIEFKGASADGFIAVAFDRIRKKLDESFNGDFAKTMTGATVRLRGKLEASGAKDPKFANRPQLIISDPSQVTIVPAETPPENTAPADASPASPAPPAQ